MKPFEVVVYISYENYSSKTTTFFAAGFWIFIQVNLWPHSQAQFDKSENGLGMRLGSFGMRQPPSIMYCG